MSTAKKTDPQLWERVKDEITRGDKGGAPGQWSARKAQMAVQEYQRRGGGYAEDGPDQEETSLNDWTEQDWGTKSGGESGETGERYLPRQARKLLTEDEYRRSTAEKRAGDSQFVDQPDDVKAKAARIRNDGPTKDDALDRARDLGIAGRSEMSKAELLDAIEAATDSDGRAKGTGDLADLSKDELYARAQAAGVEGRSDMTKDELIAALTQG